MVNIIMSGCNGRMGQVISGLVSEDPNMKIIAGVDITGEQKNDYPVFTSFALLKVEEPAVIIDFSSPLAFAGMMEYVEATGTPVVVCTTGLDEAQLKKLDEVSRKAAVLRSANMSLGINLLMKLVKDAARILAPAGFDIEIEERHHNKKKDAPSGTALALADSINEAMDNRYTYVYDRSTRYEQRGKEELGILALRGGSIVGEHSVVYAGMDEVIELKHSATSRAIFAKGAISAAAFLFGKQPGFYGMDDVIAQMTQK